MATWSSFSETAPSLPPVRALSAVDRAVRVAQTVSKALLPTIRSTVPLTSCSTNASTSICASSTLATRLVTTFCTSGSEASGPTVATWRSVSRTMLFAQTARTDSG